MSLRTGTRPDTDTPLSMCSMSQREGDVIEESEERERPQIAISPEITAKIRSKEY